MILYVFLSWWEMEIVHLLLSSAIALMHFVTMITNTAATQTIYDMHPLLYVKQTCDSKYFFCHI